MAERGFGGSRLILPSWIRRSCRERTPQASHRLNPGHRLHRSSLALRSVCGTPAALAHVLACLHRAPRSIACRCRAILQSPRSSPRCTDGMAGTCSMTSQPFVHSNSSPASASVLRVISAASPSGMEVELTIHGRGPRRARLYQKTERSSPQRRAALGAAKWAARSHPLSPDRDVLARRLSHHPWRCCCPCATSRPIPAPSARTRPPGAGIGGR